MGKKRKNKVIIRPWCWYCEREFEDEKVLMQHQKAKHFKCKWCPRRLNTAGGLAVHIQQVHKYEPENLPRIENTLPGRDGYEIEIFGMEGIPAPDVADYKRRKEIELGLNPGTITQPQAKRPKFENRVFTQEELRIQLEAHKALMGAVDNPPPVAPDQSSGAVVNAAPQTYAAPPSQISPPPGSVPPAIPPFLPGGAPPPMPGPGQLPFPPLPGAPGFPPGPPPAGFTVPPCFPPPGALPPGAPPFPPGIPPAGLPPGAPPFAPGAIPPPLGQPPPAFSPPPNSSTSAAPMPPGAPHFPPPASEKPDPSQAMQQPASSAIPQKPPIPDPSRKQENPKIKGGQVLKYTDANYSPEENRAYDPKYFFSPQQTSMATANQDETRGKKRARAEDFL